MQENTHPHCLWENNDGRTSVITEGVEVGVDGWAGLLLCFDPNSEKAKTLNLSHSAATSGRRVSHRSNFTIKVKKTQAGD